MRGAATRGRKTDLGGLRCADPPGVTMWVIHTLALNEVNGVTVEGPIDRAHRRLIGPRCMCRYPDSFVKNHYRLVQPMCRPYRPERS